MTVRYTTDEALDAGLHASNTPATRAVLQDRDLYAFVLTQFNNTLKMASGDPGRIAVAIADKTASTAKLAGKAGGSHGLVVGVTAGQIVLATAALANATKNPALAVSALFAKKTALAFGLAGSDDKRAKCIAAFADMTAAGLSLGLVSATGPLGAVLIGAGLAQLALSGYQFHQACIAHAR